MSARMIIMANNIDEVGGAQRVAHSLAQGFANRGFQVELVGVVPHEPCHQFTEDPAYRSITLAERPLPSASDPAGRKRARTSILHSLQALLDSGEPGIIITTQLLGPFKPHLFNDITFLAQFHPSYRDDLIRVIDRPRGLIFEPATSMSERICMLKPLQFIGFSAGGSSQGYLLRRTPGYGTLSDPVLT
jgi:hypothetical protein